VEKISVSRKRQSILVVDDDQRQLTILSETLDGFGYEILLADDGVTAVDKALRLEPDLILLDIEMPMMDGYEVCRILKRDIRSRGIPIIFISGMENEESKVKAFELGATDFITKPFYLEEIRARIKMHMELHLYQEHLEELVAERTEQLRSGYIDTIHRLVLAAEYKDEDTGAHIKRISYCSREIACRLGMDMEFCEAILYASPMHDIGKVAIADAILFKKGPLNTQECEIMKTHTAIGARILAGSVSPYLQMAVDIARYHHERWDGSGYPSGFKGEQIPLTARIMTISDQYDALRSKRPYKPAFDHKKTLSIITKGDGRTMPGHFDPEILSAFKKEADVLNDIFTTHNDEKWERVYSQSRCSVSCRDQLTPGRATAWKTPRTCEISPTPRREV